MMQPSDYLRLIRDNWILLIVSCLGAGALAFAVNSAQAPAYRATTTLSVTACVSVEFSGGCEPILEPFFAADRAVVYADLALSNQVLDEAISSVDFEVNVGTLREGLSVTPRSGSPLINVTVDWPVESQSADLANAVSSALIQYGQQALDGMDQESTSVQLVVTNPADEVQRIAGSGTTAGALGLTLGLALGLGVAFLRYFLNSRLRTSSEAAELTALDLLGHVPLGKMVVRRPKVSSTAVIDESVRRVRAGVIHRMQASGARTILVTASQTGEDSDEVATALASSIAETGVRVLLIEADLNDRTIGGRFQIESTTGLIDLTEGVAPAEQYLRHVGTSTRAFLSAGSQDVDGAQFLSNGIVLERIGEVSASFDCVVIAAPSILDTPQTLTLLPAADAVVIVAAVGAVHRLNLIRAVHALDQLGKRPIGVITTGAA